MKHYSPVKVGIATSIMILAIALLMLWQSGLVIQATGYKLIGHFSAINGLLNGSEVRYRGYKVGKVFEVNPNPKNIEVVFFIQGNVKVPKGSTLRVVFDGLIGEKYIEIKPNAEGTEMLHEGDILQGDASAGLADFVDLASKNLEETRAIFAAFREVFASDDMVSSMKRIIMDVQVISDSMANISSSIDQAQIANIAQKVSLIATDLSETSSSLRSLLHDLEDREVANRVASILDNLDKFTAEIAGVDTGDSSNGGLAKNIRDISKAISSIHIEGQGAFRYYVPEENPAFSGDVDIHIQQKFLRLGVSNRWGDTQFVNAQIGFPFAEAFEARFGVIQKYPGIGLGFSPIPALGFTVDAYNFKDISVDLEARLGVTPLFNLLAGLSRDPISKSFDNYFFGVMITP